MLSQPNNSTPGFVAAYVIRSPEQVDASADHRELTSLALYAPVLCALSLVGLYFAEWKKGDEDEMEDAYEGTVPGGEGTPLVVKGSSMARKKSSVAGLNQAFGRTNVVARRSSVEIMGLTAGYDTLAEQETKKNQLADLEEFKMLFEMDDDE